MLRWVIWSHELKHISWWEELPGGSVPVQFMDRDEALEFMEEERAGVADTQDEPVFVRIKEDGPITAGTNQWQFPSFGLVKTLDELRRDAGR